MNAPRTRTDIIDCTCGTYTRPHGTAHTYNTHGCGCDPCRLAALADHLDRKRHPRLVPVGRTRARLDMLTSRGMTLDQIARMIDAPYSTVADIRRPTRRRVSTGLALALRGIPIPAMPDPPLCTVDGCRRPHRANGLCHMHNQRRARERRRAA